MSQRSRKLENFKLQSQFLRPNFSWSFWKQFTHLNTRRPIFIKNTCNSKHFKTGSFGKNVPKYWRRWLKKSCKLSKNPLNMLINVQKSIEFHLIYQEVPQPTTVIKLLYSLASKSLWHNYSLKWPLSSTSTIKFRTRLWWGWWCICQQQQGKNNVFRTIA